MSKYEIERIKRGAPSRRRKVSFALKQIVFIRIDDQMLVKCGSFQSGFRNADGGPRKPKVLMRRKRWEEDIIHSVDFA